MAEIVTTDAESIYLEYRIKMNPKWFPAFYVLSKNDKSTITYIAQAIGHSHVSVSKIIAEMTRGKLVLSKSDATDWRQSHLRLSTQRQKILKQIGDQYLDVDAAVEELITESKHDLWESLREAELGLTQKSLLARVLDNKKRRENSMVEIVEYEESTQQYFKVEQPDFDALDQHKQYILDRGGFIFVPLLNQKPVGVCVLIFREDARYPYELAKVAVPPLAQRKNIGFLLGQAVFEKKRVKGRSSFSSEQYPAHSGG